MRDVRLKIERIHVNMASSERDLREHYHGRHVAAFFFKEDTKDEMIDNDFLIRIL